MFILIFEMDMEKIFALITVCHKRLERNPNDADAWFTKGLALAKLKEYTESIHCLDHVTRVDMAYPGVWRLKAKVYALMKDQMMSDLCRETATRLEDQSEYPSIRRIPSASVA